MNGQLIRTTPWPSLFGLLGMVLSGRVGKHSKLSMVEWWGWERVSKRGG